MRGLNGAALPVIFAIASTLGGLLHTTKGAVLVAGGPDLSLVPAMTFLFAFGLLGLCPSLKGRAATMGLIGCVFVLLALASAAVSLLYLTLGIAPEDEGAPLLVKVTYASATGGIFVGLLLLGAATTRAGKLGKGWKWLPLAVGIAWFPLEGLTGVLPDGWGLMLAGLTWLVVGMVQITHRKDLENALNSSADVAASGPSGPSPC